MIFALVVCGISALIIWTIHGLVSNYLIARKIGLPIILTPIDSLNPVWVLARPVLDPLIRQLPFGLGDFAGYSYLGWGWEQRYRLHRRYGDGFVVVTPAECQLVLGDVDAAAEVLNRWKDFIKSPAMFAPFNIFGPNVLTAEHETWQRHRRITTPPFNERNSALVWSEAARQARDMLAGWNSTTSTSPIGKVGTIRDDAYTVALNVLSGAGFGKPQQFDNSQYRRAESGSEIPVLEAMQTIMHNMFAILIMNSAAKAPAWLLPRSWKRVRQSLVECRKHLVEMVKAEQEAYARGQGEGEDCHNLMSTLVRVSEQAKLHGDTDKETRRPWLSDDEIYGNLWLYHLAGHETTANALTYGIAFLAAHPELQDWIGEEIQHVMGDEKDDAAGYEEAFPRLKRCLAIMYESLRLYSPANGIPRWTGDSSQTLKIGDKTVVLPPRTSVLANNAATQTNPKLWGDDADIWRPSRWISDGGGSPDKEELLPGPLGGRAFLAWACGPRICPGKKFSQVEFVAVLASLFRSHRVEPVLEAGEDMWDARRRIERVVQDSHVDLTVTIRHPERIKLRWLPKRRV
ncbi:uncharacterized protein Z520_01179 [Fonsecaea multimorphosa CBS 102226]|uniref:Cytochrome P450 monooxygenase n=1 Tax=Fonsecaea multimorphosa CBS 102226 TaxID=1442371 RepID=A0A0D2L102_9EURO|nr:uncharacterized protein Z520_01179 [Fonsecaea multimorphosa CBS 102226]KIY02714.1 hypothetical protein Z520_01179 [Fonsecaea multimorphosa CBS 102226]OAL31575.1 hypothetical protein AYO22_01167 [Fonsecaea multimorphosa]